MGCFNATCNLSGLQIYHGDKIKLVVTLPPLGERESSLVYPSDLRIPCFLPVSGEYDDYGCIENIDKADLTPMLIDSLFKEAKVNRCLKPTDRFRDQYEHEQYDGSKWFKHIGTEGFRVGRFPGNTLKKKDDGVFMSYSLVLQEVWDSYITTYDRANGIRTRVEQSLDRWFAWYTKVAEEVLAHPDKSSAIWASSRWGKDLQYNRDENFKVPALPERESMTLHFMSDMGRELDSNWFTAVYFEGFLYPLFMAKAFEQEKGQRMWQWFRKTYAEFAIICSLMHCLPRFWMPTMTAGQDREYKLHVDIATATHKIAKRRLTKYEKENGE